MKCYYFISLLSCFLFFQVNIKGQVVLHGIVTTQNSLPISTVSVTLLQHERIVAYNITNNKGEYKILLQKNANFDTAFSLQFSYVGYQKIRVPLKANTTVYNTQLIISKIDLPNVVVKSNSFITKNGDTINYNVNAFTQKQDRVIGDVLKKIPGIEVQENGKILYNGKAISNFYIDGDDLLDDRYNIATNTIPAEMVDKVQILENHQPIRALENIKLSNDVALNLKLKNSAKLKLHSTAQIGVGLPKNHDVALNTLGFFKKQKFINTIKTNNIGNNIKNEVVQLNYQDYLKSIEKEEIGRVLQPEIVSFLPIKQRRFLQNNSLLINFNTLQNIKKDVQLKVKLFYLPENIKAQQNTQSFIYLLTDTIQYKERQNSKSKTHQLFGDLQLQVNKSTFYIKNKLSFQNNMDKINGIIERSSDTIHQKYTDKTTSIANDFSILKIINGKYILNFFSYVTYAKQPEEMAYIKGLYPILLNDSINYNTTIQKKTLSTFFTNNYFSYTKRNSKYFLQSYTLGNSYQHQNLLTDVLLELNNNTFKSAADSFSNNYEWQKNKIYFNVDNTWTKGNLKLNVKIPISYLNFILQLNKQSRWLINPSFNIRYEVGKENSLTGNFFSNNYFGNIQELYTGYILQNYRTVVANNGVLGEAKQRYYNIGFHFRRAAKLFNINLILKYDNTAYNTITNTFVSSISDIKQKIFLNNIQENLSLNISVSKYIFSIGTNFYAKLNIQKQNQFQLLNNNLQPFTSYNTFYSFGGSYKKSSWFSIVHNANLSKTVTKSHSVSTAQKQKIIQLQQILECYFFPTKKIITSFVVEQLYNTGSVNTIVKKLYFVDLSLRYRFNKIKTDFEINCTNLFSNDKYYNPFSANNFLSETTVLLNPRMLVAKIFIVF